MTFLDTYWTDYDDCYQSRLTVNIAKKLITISTFSSIVNLILGFLIFICANNQNNKYIVIDMQDTEQTNLNQEVEINQTHRKLYLMRKWLEILFSLSFFIIMYSLSLITVIFATFDYCSSFVATFCLFLSGLLGLIFQLWRISEFKGKIQQIHLEQHLIQRIMCSIKNFKFLIIIEVLIISFISTLTPFLFSKGCICDFNFGYKLNSFSDYYFSTEISRGFWLPNQICELGNICHVYATLPQDTDNQVFINVHTGIDISKLDLIIQNDNDQNDDNLIQCESIPFPQKIEKRGQRNVYTCFIQNLNASTFYNFSLISNDKILKMIQYKTLPNYGSQENVKIFFGGDWGYLENGLKITNQIKEIQPDIILIGGDIAYDNGIIHCYYSQDLFLYAFEQQFESINRIIPFIFSIGNHDIGFNDYSKYNISVSQDNGPLYFIYYPQQIQNNKTLFIENRVTYNLHKIQNLLLFGLDSGYLYSHNGTQFEWMKQILNNQDYNNYSKFAHYHVPLYPTCYENKTESWENILSARKSWIQLFDQYSFIGAFENHVHQYKRTYPLKNNEQHQNGTVYFGDGSLGIRQEQCIEEQKMYGQNKPFNHLFETVIYYYSSHFWILNSYGQNQSLQFDAYFPNNSFIQNSTYKTQLYLQSNIQYDL